MLLSVKTGLVYYQYDVEDAMANDMRYEFAAQGVRASVLNKSK